MKKSITPTLITLLVIFFTHFSASAQVTPTTPGVKLFCDGGTLNIDPPTAGNTWVVRYSATQTTTPTTGVTLTNNTIAATDLKSGYYYLYNTASGACESEAQEIPVFVFPTLIPEFTYADYCVDAGSGALNSTTVNPDPTNLSLAYQWYTVVGGTETAISGATSSTYTPPTATANTTTTYRLKVGFLVGTDKYCGNTIDHDVTAKPKPTAPSVTIGGTTTSW